MDMYTMHYDPGHGWLEVPKAEVRAAGVKPSQYSYQDEKNFYLEEDCDAGAFAKAVGITAANVREIGTDYDSWIRGLRRC